MTYMVQTMNKQSFESGWNSFSQGDSVIIDDIDTTVVGLQQAFGVETREELESLLMTLDQDGDGALSRMEACKHFMGDTLFGCHLPHAPAIDPDYA